ncbi:MAG TPA: hypothetical protein VMN79_17020 [Casimicrobiaceae bacterium]|nr:hypothetical protein [Casimicrobiaceae bacterium]
MKRALACITGVAFAAMAAAAQSAEQKIVGTVVTSDAAGLEVKAADGKIVSLRLGDELRLSARSSSDLSKLEQGAFVGTTAAPQPDGTLLASEVHVHPESMRGRGEGHRPMANLPGSTMTNATISRVGANQPGQRTTTTDATIERVSSAPGGRTMTLTYKGGEKTIVVPEGTPIVMVEPADRSLLVAGAHVVAYGEAQADGTIAASRLTVGVKGYAPQ